MKDASPSVPLVCSSSCIIHFSPLNRSKPTDLSKDLHSPPFGKHLSPAQHSETLQLPAGTALTVHLFFSSHTADTPLPKIASLARPNREFTALVLLCLLPAFDSFVASSPEILHYLASVTPPHGFLSTSCHSLPGFLLNLQISLCPT